MDVKRGFMKIVICDYKADLGRPYEYEIDL